jgi:sulfate adenylyltransferase large subunit
MESKSMNVVFVGHVDHGKSTIIGRLLHDTNVIPPAEIEKVREICQKEGKEFEYAFLLDHMHEERAQGITIDTAQMFFQTLKRRYIIIDAPGHKEFTKNMITGASQADAAILIIDAKEGLKEQTQRHAYILSMLGLKQTIVIINKMDLVDWNLQRFNSLKDEIMMFLNNLGILPSQIIPISAKEGENVTKKSEKSSWYGGPNLLEALDKFKINNLLVATSMRFPIQDVYKIGDKRILVGRMESGEMKVGDKLTFLPSQKESDVKTIEVYQKEKTQAVPGECVGITIDDPHFIERGEIACNGSMPVVKNELIAKIFWMAKTELKLHEAVSMKCATQEVTCVVSQINSKINSSTLERIESNGSIRTNEAAEVSIKTEKPLVIESFNQLPELGRFVIVKDNDISAGGIITEVN